MDKNELRRHPAGNRFNRIAVFAEVSNGLDKRPLRAYV